MTREAAIRDAKQNALTTQHACFVIMHRESEEYFVDNRPINTKDIVTVLKVWSDSEVMRWNAGVQS